MGKHLGESHEPVEANLVDDRVGAQPSFRLSLDNLLHFVDHVCGITHDPQPNDHIPVEEGPRGHFPKVLKIVLI